MARISYLKRRGSTYYARMPVPLDLQDVLGTKELAKSLDTREPREAKRRLTAVIAGWQRQFEDQRRRREIEPADLAHAVWDHYTGELGQDDSARQALPVQADIDSASRELFASADRGEVRGEGPLGIMAATLDIDVLQSRATAQQDNRKAQSSMMRQHVASGETALIEWAADDYIVRRQLLVEKGTPAYRDLCLRLQRAHIEALNRTFERDAGDYTGTPSDPIVVPPSPGQTATAGPGESVMELFEQYARENSKQVKPDTLDQSRHAVEHFVETVGRSYPAAKIDKKSVREWKAILMQWPVRANEIRVFSGMTARQIIEANKTHGKATIKTKTINRYLAGLGAFCDWLQRNEFIESNPVVGLYQSIDRKKRTTVPFTVDQMNTIFSSPHFAGCESDRRNHRPGTHKISDHRYWVPLVMAFSGARPGEISQLNIADVRQEHGQWIMHITDEGDASEDKSVKTRDSKRVVPVHSELVRLGFVNYHAKVRVRGGVRLFPEAERNARGQMAAKFSTDFPKMLTRIGVKDGRGLSLYSFRHAFTDALRRAEYLDDQFGFLVGHTSHTVTGQYGTLPQGMLRQRVEMIEKVAYPGLNLAHLQPPS